MGGLSRRELQVIAAILAVTVLAGVAHYAGWAALLAFAIATVALAGLAHLVSLATEQVGERWGPGATGVLQSTLGNLPELFVVIFALRAGEVVVAQTSIIGSLLVNALLVLGLVIVLGARQASDGVMRFGPRLPNDTATLLLVASFIIVIVGVAHETHEPAAQHERAISTVAAIALLGVYLAWVVPYLRGEAPRAQEHGSAPRVALPVSIALLAAGGVGAAFVSDWFVAALGSWSSPSRATRSRTWRDWCSPARARPTWRSRWSRTRSRRWRPSCTRRWCSFRCSSPTS